MTFDRRAFLTAASATAMLRPASAQTPAARMDAAKVAITLQPERKLGVIPADFMGLGYEITTIALPDVLSARNKPYLQLVKNLGGKGMIRVGGNTSDYSRYDATAKPQDAPHGVVINDDGLKQLRGFLDALGWKLIWGLNLGDDKLDNAVAEAKAVAAIIGPRLLALEIGNEPDLFPRNGHRATGYDYAAWHGDYQRYKAAVRAAVPHAPFAGPDLAGATDWMGFYARDEARDAVLLTAHHYISGQASPSAGIDNMLATNSRYQATIEGFTGVAKAARLPWRMCETASYSGGGKEGVSNTFASALWALDYLFVLAQAGCSGVNMQTGVNHLGWVSHYSPIGEGGGGFHAAPEYYGLLAFAQAGRGSLVNTTVGPFVSAADRQRASEIMSRIVAIGPSDGVYATSAELPSFNVTAYATQPRPGQTIVTIINKDQVQDANVVIGGVRGQGRVTRLQAPGVSATSGVTLGGSAVAEDGTWKATATETVAPGATLLVPAGSAALVSFGV